MTETELSEKIITLTKDLADLNILYYAAVAAYNEADSALAITILNKQEAEKALVDAILKAAEKEKARATNNLAITEIPQ